MFFLGKLLAVKTVAQIAAPVIQTKAGVIDKIVQSINTKVEAITSKIKDLFDQEDPKTDPEPENGDDELTSVPGGTSEAVVVYDQSGDGEPDTYVRLSTDEVENPDDLDSYVSTADARLAENGTEATLQKVIFENADGEVTKVLYRTEDGEWSETDPNAAQDIIQPLSDAELAELDTGEEPAEEEEELEAA